jgi:dTDP-4-amino-4,6-dideoxygalactose transaminase
MSSNHLAIFGGKPAFPEGLHVGRPNIGDRDKLLSRINDMLDRRWLTNRGPFVIDLEERIARLLGVRHCVAMCNGTVAMEIAVRALALEGEVIVPSMTFIATAHALQWQKITPVFCDIDPVTHNIDPDCVEALITPLTTAIIGVHLWGRPCEVSRLEEIARRHDLKLIFDAAHAFHCSCRGSMVGGFGDAEILSFHATKFINTLEGGAVTTNDDELAARIRRMQNFGFETYDTVVSIGTNGKMDEMSAAMGLTSLESLDEFIQKNYENYLCYRTALAGMPGVGLVPFDDRERCSYQYVVLEVDEEQSGISRDDLARILWAEGVYARRYFYPGCHRMEPYRTLNPNAGILLPETEKLAERLLVLPTGISVGKSEIETVCQILRLAIAGRVEVRSELASLCWQAGSMVGSPCGLSLGGER